VNGDGNMPYDICEEVTTLDFIETEMSNRGRERFFYFMIIIYYPCFFY